MNNTNTWLLVCDASKARLFNLHKAILLREENSKNLELVGQYSHIESRMKGADLVSDRSGVFGSGNFNESNHPREHEAEQFAHELVSHLESGRKENLYRDLILVAPPGFMGLLHKQMSADLYKLVAQRIEKDYTHDTDKELVKNLMPHF